MYLVIKFVCGSISIAERLNKPHNIWKLPSFFLSHFYCGICDWVAVYMTSDTGWYSSEATCPNSRWAEPTSGGWGVPARLHLKAEAQNN